MDFWGNMDFWERVAYLLAEKWASDADPAECLGMLQAWTHEDDPARLVEWAARTIEVNIKPL